MSSNSIGAPAPNQANDSKSITPADAIERAKDLGDAGEEIRDAIYCEYFGAYSGSRCASTSVLMCQLGGAASNASMCPSLYEFVFECVEAGILPQLKHPEMPRQMGDKEISGCETEYALFNAFTFRLEPEDYKYWWNSTGDSGQIPFSEIEKEHISFAKEMEA